MTSNDIDQHLGLDVSCIHVTFCMQIFILLNSQLVGYTSQYKICTSLVFLIIIHEHLIYIRS